MNYKRRILTSVVMLVLMVVALSTGVFAWFTINTKTEATSLEGTAEALDGGFLISTSGEDGTYATSISLSGVTSESFKFVDTTTTNGINMVDMNGDEINSGYLEFDLYFLTGEERDTIYLTYLEIEDVTQGASWVAEKDISYGDNQILKQGTIMKANLSSALRVSIQEKSSETLNIFEKYGSEENINVAFDSNKETATFNNTTGFGGFAVDYYEAIMNKTLTVPTDRGDIIINENHTTDTKIAKAVTQNTNDLGVDATFTKGTKVKVRVWLEGWDGEAFNAIHSGKVSLTFNFNVREEEK